MVAQAFTEAYRHDPAAMTDAEMDWFRRFIYEHAGISLAPHKRHLVTGRLKRRLLHHGLSSYRDYQRLVEHPSEAQERQIIVDLLTTNETYFYREPAHFQLLRDEVLPRYRGRRFRAWSAACSTGEEVYTLAMVLADVLGMGDWEILGSDISETVLAKARAGHYPMERARGLPPELLRQYCLKGVRSQAGTLLIDPRLRQRVRFQAINLKRPLPQLGKFDLVLLRNVLIYFDLPTKREVVQRVTETLEPGGHLITSHVESLHKVTDSLSMLRPSVFRRLQGSP
ncbi:protein-glutamate O-methyltransferase CheR [Thiorhodococcus minor]|uniref:Chemotaxis protein methyltransferase n=2 Tax=Thiorhodococcus minor TaxID=57489 RepID=A0A6M0K612_9GAMM|nr:protein-glutamate O-methyltransferase CheR [Thiorhodococcus minor]